MATRFPRALVREIAIDESAAWREELTGLSRKRDLPGSLRLATGHKVSTRFPRPPFVATAVCAATIASRGEYLTNLGAQGSGLDVGSDGLEFTAHGVCAEGADAPRTEQS